MDLRSFLTADVIAHEKREVLTGRLDIFHFVEDISGKHSGFLCRRIFKNLHGRDNSGIYILADLNADPAVGTGIFLVQTGIFVLIIIHRIRIVQRIHVDPVFRCPVLLLFFLRHVLIKQEVLVDQCLHVLKLRLDLFHIQLVGIRSSRLCALTLRSPTPDDPYSGCKSNHCKSRKSRHKCAHQDAFPEFIFRLFLFQCLLSFILLQLFLSGDFSLPLLSEIHYVQQSLSRSELSA